MFKAVVRLQYQNHIKYIEYTGVSSILKKKYPHTTSSFYCNYKKSLKNFKILPHLYLTSIV